MRAIRMTPLLAPEPEFRPDCPPFCGSGQRCLWCRAEIRAEALEWIRELNAPPVNRMLLRLE